ncbi:MAG: SGNH/GDSL hydrolase family protein [Pseudomonadota bacterium]
MPHNGDIQKIIYFGDSMTDGGALNALTLRLLTQPFPLESFGYSTRITNGQNYADVTPALLGAETENFAFGGARAIGVRPLGEAVDPGVAGAFLVDDPDPADLALDINLGGQVQRFLSTLGPEGAAPGTAASIFIGLNDFNRFEPTDPANIEAEAAALAAGVAGATLGAAATLAAAGVETIIINTLPAPSIFPSFKFAPPLIQAVGDQVIGQYNDALTAQAQGLEALGVEVKIVDLAAIAGEVAADPSAFGFATVTEQLYFGTAADPIIIDGPEGPVPFFPSNPAVDGLTLDQIAFIDLFHPTEALHETFGVFSAESLTSDVAILSDERDVEIGTRADDLVLAKGGDDVLFLRKGDDVALGGTGDDKIIAGRGSDIASGGAGNDKIFGGRGDDVVAGGDGDDFLKGGRGDDAIIDGLGADIAFGGRGNDVFFFTEASLAFGEQEGTDLFFGGRGHDTLVLSLTEETLAEIGDDLACFHGGALWLEEIGLKAFGFESVVIADPADPAFAADPGGDLGDRLVEAELWGFV